MRNHSQRLALGVVVLGVALAMALPAAAIAQDTGTTIKEMKEAAGAQVSPDVQRAVEKAEACLKAGDAYAAKLEIARLLRTLPKLTMEELAVVEPVDNKIDQALGADKEKIQRQIDEQLKQEGVQELSPAEKLMLDFRRRELLKRQVNQQMAQAAVELAKTELYVNRNYAEALRLANQAIALDSYNQAARDLATEAMGKLGNEDAQYKEKLQRAAELPRIRVENLEQQLANAKAQAARFYAEDKFKDSVEQWRKAEVYANTLSVYGDRSKDLQEIDRSLKLAEAGADQQERAHQAAMQKEAGTAMATTIKDVEEAQAVDKARRVEEAYDELRRRNFDAAEKIVREAEYQDKADKAARFLGQDIERERYKYFVGQYVRRAEAESLKLTEQVYEKSIPYSALMNFPSKEIWEKIKQREAVLYPSKAKEYTPEEEEVVRKLEQKVKLAFEETPLPQVVEFLQEMTGVNFSLDRKDLGPDLNPITLRMETTLRTALDQICDLSGMAWKVEGPLVKIGKPEKLKDYEMRVYDIRDLLLNTEDKISQRTPTLGQTSAVRLNQQQSGLGGGLGGYGSTGTFGGTGGTGGAFGRAGGIGTFGGTGGTTGFGGRPGELGYGGESLMDRADALRLLIMDTIAPDTWKEGGRVTAEGAPGAPRATTSIWETGGTSAFGEAVPGEEEAAGPRGRAFFRAGNPGDLVIIQTPEVHEQIEALLRELRKAMNIQVAVESRYLELSNNYVQEVGFDWPDIDFSPGAAAAAGNNAAADNNAADNDATGNNAAVAEAKDLTFRTGLPFFGEAAGSGMMLNWTLSIFDSLKITSLFRAAQQDERSKTLSAPRIVLMNAQRGHLTIETSQNYMSGLTTGQGTFQPEISTIASAVSLDVRPIVSADRRYVFLELAPVVSDVLGFDTFTFTSPGGGGGGGDSGNNAAADNGPVTNQIRLPRQVSQTFETTVCVPDRGVLMVGGQTRHQIAQIEHGTPILNKIPIIKRLFTAEGTSNTRSMLLILVRPQIIILQEEEEAFY